MTEGVSLVSLAKEALKPASGLLDAVLAPKIESLRKWASGRELEKKVESSKLENSLNDYLHQLLRRASGLTTIVFPQQVLPLPEVYEPLKPVERYGSRSSAGLRIRRAGSRTYIVDSAGMGKSTFVKHLIISDILESDRIPILLELRRVPSGTSLYEALAAELGSLEGALEEDVVKRLLTLGRFLVVLDGFDEVPVGDRQRRAKEIEDLSRKADKSAIIITARPETELPSLPNGRVLAFQPLTQTQAESLLRRYDLVGGLDVGERLISELASIPQRFLETPLLVALLYRTFGFNGSISTRVSSFYEEIYGALYKGHDLSKAGFAREKSSGLDVEEFRRLLRALCFYMISQEIVSFSSEAQAAATIDNACRLVTVQPKSSRTFFEDLLLPVPLLVRDGSEVRFLHKTIVEFFAAEYLAYVPSADELLAKVVSSRLLSRFSGVFDYLAEISPSLFRKHLGEPLAKAVLRHRTRLTGSVGFTLSLLFKQIRVSLWPYKEVILPDGDLKIPMPSNHPGGVSYFYSSELEGEGGERSFVLAVAPEESRLNASRTAWEGISEGSLPHSGEHLGLTFGLIDEWLPQREWVSLLSPEYQSVIDTDLIGNVAVVLLAGRLGGRGSAREFGLASKSKATQLIDLIKQEAQNRRWLDGLLRA